MPVAATAMRVPPLPTGRSVEVPGRGRAFVREIRAPWPGAATVVLLHGWTATADLNFFRCYAPLGQQFHVLAMDLRGHGRGIRSVRPFRLSTCADDVVALADVLGIERFVPAGYSMGGAVAQVLAHRHPDRMAGLVLAATSARFSSTRESRLAVAGLAGLAGLARLVPESARRRITQQLYLSRKAQTYEPWALHEASRHDWRMVLEAGSALGTFDSRAWLGDITTPATVIATMRDGLVPVEHQLELANAIPRCSVMRIDAAHDAAVTAPAEFNPALLRACAGVVARSTITTA